MRGVDGVVEDDGEGGGERGKQHDAAEANPAGDHVIGHFGLL